MKRIVARIVVGLACNTDPGTPLHEWGVHWYAKRCLP